jgi:hypothetical protein
LDNVITYLQVCVWCAFQLLLDALRKRSQAVVQLLLEKLEQQVARQQQLMVRQRIRVVLAALPVDLAAFKPAFGIGLKWRSRKRKCLNQ